MRRFSHFKKAKKRGSPLSPLNIVYSLLSTLYSLLLLLLLKYCCRAFAPPRLLSHSRWAGDKGAYFFETMARRGFGVEAVDPGDIDERYRGDSGISFSRIRLRNPL